MRAARMVLFLTAGIEGYAAKRAANADCSRTPLAALELSVLIRDLHCKITPSVQLYLSVLVHFVACKAAAVANKGQRCYNRVSFCLVAPALCFLPLCCRPDGASPSGEIDNHSIPNRIPLIIDHTWVCQSSNTGKHHAAYKLCGLM